MTQIVALRQTTYRSLCCIGMVVFIALCTGCSNSVSSNKYKISFEAPPGFAPISISNPSVILATHKNEGNAETAIVVAGSDVSDIAVPPQQTVAQYTKNAMWASASEQPELHPLGESERKVGSNDGVVIEYTYRGKSDGRVTRVRQVALTRNHTHYNFTFLTSPELFDREVKNFDNMLNSVHWLP